MRRRHVTILLIPGALGSTVTIPLEMLNAANDIARAQRRPDLRITVQLAGSNVGDMTLNGGLRVHCPARLGSIDTTDLIFIPGLWGNPRAAVRRNQTLIDWLVRQYDQGATLCGIASGTFLIAATGLLDNRPATTHWRHFDLFSELHPWVKLQRKRFITHDQRLFCTGSVNAARDIMQHFVALLFSDAIASQVARHFTHELKRSYESLLLNEDQSSTHHDETIIKVQEWIQDNYTKPIPVTEIARRFQLSVRSLNRRFKQATNTTPLQYLQDLRISQAKDLLKQSNLVIAEVADQVGYQDASYFTGLFKKLNAITPNEYRRLVRNKLFVAQTSGQQG